MQIEEYIKKNWATVNATDIGDKYGIHEARVRRLAKKLGLPKKSTMNTTFDTALLTHGFDGQEWSHGWLKADGASIFIKNDKGIMTYMDMRDELVEEMKKYAPKYPVIKRTKGTGHVLVVDPADVHFNKLALKEETGEEYNLDIATKRFQEGIDSLISKVSAFDVQSIVLVLGNDVLNSDTVTSTTTAGTPQDDDTQWWRAFQVAKQCYIKAIEKLLTLGDVKLVHCPSNHDVMTGYFLSDAVSSWFAHNKNVTADVSIQHRKYLQFGKNMIGFTHGDGARNEDLPNHMMTETNGIPFDFGYWYVHHGHHKDKKIKRQGQKMEQVEKGKLRVTEIQTGLKITPRNTIHVEMITPVTTSDRWHYNNGYYGIQGMEAFLHHPVEGQVARITHHF
jgi:hypothetical protein